MSCLQKFGYLSQTSVHDIVHQDQVQILCYPKGNSKHSLQSFADGHFPQMTGVYHLDNSQVILSCVSTV